MKKLEKEARDEKLRGEISFMEFMIEKYQKLVANLKDETQLKGVCWPKDWMGPNKRMLGLDALYRKQHNQEIEFYEECIKECRSVITKIEKILK